MEIKDPLQSPTSKAAIITNKNTEDTNAATIIDLDSILLHTDLLLELLFLLFASKPLTAIRALFCWRNGKASFASYLFKATSFNFTSTETTRKIIQIQNEATSAEKIIKFSLRNEILRNFFLHCDANILHRRSMLLNDFVEDINHESGKKLFNKIKIINIETINKVNGSFYIYIKLIRAHQWAKNMLIFAPGIAAHTLSLSSISYGILSFIIFSLCASSVYLLNDLLDLQNDRLHAGKKNRPLASGAVPLTHGLALSLMLLASALAMAPIVSINFLLIICVYYAITLAYSLFLKRQLIIDVVTLASLYGMRLAAGGIVFAVPISEWLIAFSIFIFLSLALVKRATELAACLRLGDEVAPGRAYRLDDLLILEILAASSGFASVLVFALYINSPEVKILYHSPKALWFCGLVLIYWLCRIMLLTHRGQMNDDPVIFAATDRASLICAGLLGLTLLAASL